jgi:hypothetical protein
VELDVIDNLTDMTNNIEIIAFFFGSPHAGFSAYPSDYTDWVSGLDANKSEYPFVCRYSIKDNRSIITYIEYNLSDEQRSGRNFGIWVQIENFKLKCNAEEEIVKFIQDFVNEILEEKQIFFKKGNKPHFYIIESFKDVDTENIIQVFKSRLLKDFKNELIPIEHNDCVEKDLIVCEKTKSNDSKPKRQEKLKDKPAQKKSESHRSNEEKILSLAKIVGLSFLILFLLLISYQVERISYQVERISHEVKKNSDRIEILARERIRTPQPTITVQETSPKPKPKPKQKNDDQPNDKHIVVSRGDNLGGIVSRFNATHNTMFTINEIAIYNNIDNKHLKSIKKGDIISFP